MNAPLHGRERHSHKGGNAVQRHLVEKTQTQWHRIISRQTVERFDHRLISLLLSDRLRECFDLFEQRLVERDPFLQVRRLALAESQSAMARDRREPGRKL